jgi:hypothetical protein
MWAFSVANRLRSIIWHSNTISFCIIHILCQSCEFHLNDLCASLYPYMLSKQQCSQFHNHMLLDYHLCLLRVSPDGRVEGLWKLVDNAPVIITNVHYTPPANIL